MLPIPFLSISQDRDEPETQEGGPRSTGSSGGSSRSDVVAAGVSTAISALEYIRSEGYWVAFRDDGFCECLVAHGEEKWVGRGKDESKALLDVLRQMHPSRLAWQLLEQRVALHAAGAGRTVAAVALPAAAAVPPPAPPTSTPTPAADAGRSDLASTLRVVAQIHQEIAASRPRIARLAPERQRLTIQLWMSAARAEQDKLPKAADLVRVVAAIAKELTALCKVYWPGSVRALQSTAEPAFVHAGATSWAMAAAGASQALERAGVEGQKRGLDADGWADAARLDPPPASPELVLRDVVLVIEDATGPLAGHPRPPTPAVASSKQIALAAAKLRWLRGATRDAERWAQAVGRLRWVAHQLGDAARGLSSTLDPAYVPPASWAEVVQAATSRR